MYEPEELEESQSTVNCHNEESNHRSYASPFLRISF